MSSAFSLSVHPQIDTKELENESVSYLVSYKHWLQEHLVAKVILDQDADKLIHLPKHQASTDFNHCDVRRNTSHFKQV